MTMHTLREVAKSGRFVGTLAAMIVAVASSEARWIGVGAVALIVGGLVLGFLCDALDDVPGERVPHRKSY